MSVVVIDLSICVFGMLLFAQIQVDDGCTHVHLHSRSASPPEAVTKGSDEDSPPYLTFALPVQALTNVSQMSSTAIVDLATD